jgi:Rrf2 family protein
MRISTKGRYALIIMENLANKYHEDRFVRLNEIASEEELSLKYLEKIIPSLNNKDFFITSRGSDGGYKLKRKPNEYTILEILEASEGSLAPVECITSNTCNRKSMCKSIGIWKELDDTINTFLENKTLEDLMEDK